METEELKKQTLSIVEQASSLSHFSLPDAFRMDAVMGMLESMPKNSQRLGLYVLDESLERILDLHILSLLPKYQAEAKKIGTSLEEIEATVNTILLFLSSSHKLQGLSPRTSISPDAVIVQGDLKLALEVKGRLGKLSQQRWETGSQKNFTREKVVVAASDEDAWSAYQRVKPLLEEVNRRLAEN